VAADRRDIALYFAWCDQQRLLVFEVFAPDVETYVVALKASGRVETTLSRMLTSVSSFYIYAARHTAGAVVNPVVLVTRPRVSVDSPTLGLSRDELGALLRAAQGRGGRDHAMLSVLAGTAVRVTELCRADTWDVTTASGRDVLRVTRKGGKHGVVRMPAETVRAVRAYTGDRNGPLFLLNNGRRMTRRAVAYYLELCAIEAKLGKRISPHSLRHTAATLTLNEGASLRDVQLLMGHARPDTTARYDRERRELENPAADALAEVLAGVA
jgi:site-specific recombinase XerD